MSAPEIIANMSRGWNRAPVSTAVGSERTGVSAAIWTHHVDDLQEVSGPPDPYQHIVSLAYGAGKSDVFINDRRRFSRSLRAGTLNIVVAGEAPRAVLTGRWRVLHVYLPTALTADLAAELIGGSGTGLEIVDPAGVMDIEVERLGRAVLGEVRDGFPLSRLRIDALGQDLAIQLLRRWSNLADTPALEPAKGGLAPWQVKRVTDYMEDRLADDVSLEDLSKLVDLSTFHLCRAFKQSTGLPPHRWRHQRRIERARELLEGTDLPVTEVAAQVGYDDPSQLAAAFRKALGVSPTQYRRERQS